MTKRDARREEWRHKGARERGKTKEVFIIQILDDNSHREDVFIIQINLKDLVKFSLFLQM